jgi:acyl carrier protein
VEVAKWLVVQGARHLVLTSRSGLPDRAEWDGVTDDELARRITAVQELESLGATIAIAVADVADQEQMTALFARFGDDLPQLRGVMHTAVAMTGASIATMSAKTLSRMMQSKVQGTWLLHELTRELSLDFFVLFSSTTALWGVSELGHYAAANQFLDALAHYRQAQGLCATSINWGTWDVMRVASATDQASVAQFGLRRMNTGQALAALGDLLGRDGGLAQMAVVDVEWKTLKAAYEARRPKPFLSQVADIQRGTFSKKLTTPSLLQQIDDRSTADRHQIILTAVKNAAAQVLGTDPKRLTDTQQGLFDMGMDSLMSVELKGLLETAVGQSLPSTLTFNYPTIEDLTNYLDNEVLAETAVAEEEFIVVEGVQAETAVDTDDMSEDELEMLLLQRLENLE